MLILINVGGFLRYLNKLRIVLRYNRLKIEIYVFLE